MMAAPSTMVPTIPSTAMSSSAATAGIPAKTTSAAVSAQPYPTLASLRDRIPKLEPRRRQPPPENATPVPRTPQLPPPSSLQAETVEKNGQQHHHTFAIPRRRILSRHDHDLFLASPSFNLLQAWVFGLADAVVGTPAGVFAESLAPKKGPVEETEAPTTTTTSFAPVSSPHPRHSPQKPTQRPLSPVIFALLSILDEAEDLLESCPPDETGGSRFGNKRFRVFVDLVRQRAPAWHRERLGLTDDAAVAEAAAYLGQSFGNRARIDYGSGHELHFIVWLLCLYQLGVVKAPNARDSLNGSQDDRAALVLVVFVRYLALMRRIQTTYYLEPAGSHGVWGLDDYQFLPFLFGAAQLKDHRYITPRAVHQPLTLEQFGDDYLYLGQVRFVNSIKVATGRPGEDPASSNSLRWHSPMLDDISATRSWAKVEAGMRRMFLAEVLRKLPVMQHFLFGSLVPAAVGTTEPSGKHPGEEHAEIAAYEDDEIEDEDEDVIGEGKDSVEVFDKGGVRHIHNPSGWGDCCGIRVPSSLGAAGEMRKRGGDVLRRIPFD
ncbi:phosphotyrosyl phosphatase activator [Grosmannia clavigera kw1407]|uniref:Serine/threonine-protein phosphatase 2A activator n=1 Tax=Grosmannia clavigera (strain kw1407 / UAMH 11150) TaxID=655863 RepID=F0XHE4_GROCL|nr:phosphotyrosyl phosphatase activator [Grosmannia clavigera kw1407]EFX03030.1 phosphotyrosyl phosphatase activator [Grosmannia clavigera kw1407]